MRLRLPQLYIKPYKRSTPPLDLGTIKDRKEVRPYLPVPG
jgi:hypothetical protein